MTQENDLSNINTRSIDQKVADRRDSEWDVRNASRNYASLVASQAGIAVFSFVSVWLATRYLGKDGYGGLAALIAVAQIAQISIMWTCTALGRYGVEEFVSTGQISKTFWARTLIFLPNLLVVVLLSVYWLPPIGEIFKLPLASYPYVLLHLTALAFGMHVQFAVQAVKMPRLQGNLQLFERVLTLTILLVLIISAQLTFITAMWAYILPQFASTGIGIYKLFPYLRSAPQFERSRVSEIIRFSLPLPLYSLLSYFSFNYLDTVFILRYMTVSDLGVYTVAYQINGLFLQLPTLAGSLLLPYFVTAQVESDRSDLKLRYFREIVPVLTLGFGLIATGVAAVLNYFLPLIFGTGFAHAADLMWVFAAASTLTLPVATGYLPISNSVELTKVQMFAAIAAATLNVSLNIILIPRYGLMGCAWATVGAFAGNMVVFALMLGRKLQLPTMTTVGATVPTVVGAAVYSMTFSLFMSGLATLSLSALLVYFEREAIMAGVNRIGGLRKWGTSN